MIVKDYLESKLEYKDKVVYFTKQINHQEFQKGEIFLFDKDKEGECNGWLIIRNEETGRLVKRHSSEVIKIK